MDEMTLWNTFAGSGRVEDYLRYRQALAALPGEGGNDGGQTTRDDRRPGGSGLPDGSGDGPLRGHSYTG